MLIKLLSVQYFDSTIFIIYDKKNFEQKVQTLNKKFETS